MTKPRSRKSRILSREQYIEYALCNLAKIKQKERDCLKKI